MPEIGKFAPHDVEVAVNSVCAKVREVSRKAPDWARQSIIEVCAKDSARLYGQALARHRTRVKDLPPGVAGSVALLTMSLASSLVALPWHLIKTPQDQRKALELIAQGGGSSNPLDALIQEWGPQQAFFVAGPNEVLGAYLVRVAQVVRTERIEHVVLDGAIKPGLQGRAELARDVGAPLFFVHEASRADALKLPLMRGNGVEYDWNSRPAPGPGVPPSIEIKQRIASLRTN